ncbi:MAG: HAMP domain-containing histidine kinase [Phycisphaerales bacterium]|nr:MAG: HAMP domain-containing histidine kinase [Phycisphaerales bacterium]
MESLLKSTSLIQRARWLVRLRWVAIAVLGTATFFASSVMKVSLPVTALYGITGALLFYNFILHDLLKYFTWGEKRPSAGKIGRIITFQISADLFILTAILHFSGGVENPFSFFFVFHMIVASIFRSRLQSYLEATLAVVLFSLLVLLEYWGVIPHYELTGFSGHGLYREGTFVFGVLFVFACTLYMVVYMTTSISEQLRRQQESYERANAMLEQKDLLKNEYVLRLTHDIKGHLAAIESCLNIVDDQMVGALNEKQKDLVERAFRRTTKCMAFITALLKLTRMKLTGRLEKEFFPLKRGVFNAITLIQNQAARKSISVDFDIEASVDEVYGEPVLIEETIGNLLFNAIRYTPEGGKVRLSVKEREQFILVQVSDTGIGVPEEDLTKIFDEFYRAENARKVERDGTGLGLSFAKQVVERHGGKMWAENNPEGGSTFSFTLPRATGGAGNK